MDMKRKLILIIGMAVLLPASLFAETANFTFDNNVALNMVRGEIQAPIETTRFQIGAVVGHLEIDTDKLSKTKGTIKIDLSAIKSYSFDSEGKNEKQTQHMKNWFEIGPDVSEEVRMKNRWAVFNIKKIADVAPENMAAATTFTDEIGTGRAFQITAEGDLVVHGISKEKTVELSVVIYDIPAEGQRYKEAKRVAMLRTRSPLRVSMKEHDVKPRDAAGTFAAKALSVIGLKISDEVQISLDLRAYQPK